MTKTTATRAESEVLERGVVATWHDAPGLYEGGFILTSLQNRLGVSNSAFFVFCCACT